MNRDINKKLVYLASPYSSPSSFTREMREILVTKAAGILIKRHHKEYSIYCPIAHSCAIAECDHEDEMTTDHDLWMGQDLPLLSRCDELWVCMLPGWKESRGVSEEIELAKVIGLPIRYLNMKDEFEEAE